MAKRKHAYTDEELEKVMNTPGSTDLISESESEGEIDGLEADLLYDSDSDVEYTPLPGEDSSDDDGEEVCGGKRKKQKRKVVVISSGTSPVPTASTSDGRCATSPVPTASTSDASHAPSPAAIGKGRSHRRRQCETPSIVTFNTSTLSSKSQFRWSCRPQSQTSIRTLSRNIIQSFTPGPVPGEARDAASPEEVFSLFLNDEIVNIIVKWTNQKIDILSPRYSRQTATYAHTEPKEIRALLGILVISGEKNDGHIPTEEMWSLDVGCSLYRVAMSEARFKFLIRCLRFDDAETREARKKDDKFAPVREVWDIFIRNCGRLYVPHVNLTVDEQLLGFRGRCPFRMYIPNKPAKYGIKLVLINDSKTKYLLGGIPYLGKEMVEDRGNLQLGHYYTKELTRPYHGSNRNVTTDNWFTSVPLVSDLLNNHGMTLVGTLRANKKEVPNDITDKQTRKQGSSAFLYTKEMMLVSYVANTSSTKKKLVLLLSSQHTQPTIGSTGKPEVIEFYNSTKGGTDTFDQMCSVTSCSRKTRRWPLCIMYGLVNAANVNSYIIFRENLQRKGEQVTERTKFLILLGKALITPWAQTRLHLSLPRPLQMLISTVCDIPSLGSAAHSSGTSFANSSGALVRCVECPCKSDRKTRHRCNRCTKAKCPRHLYPVCGDCM